MFWIFPALGASLTDAVHNVFIKKQTNALDPLYVSWIRSFWIAIILLPLIFLFPADPSKTFWIVCFFRIILDSMATVLYVRSISYTDLSLALPLIALSPLLIAVMEFVFLGTKFSYIGGTGIALVVIGIYTLNLKRGNRMYSPFVNIYRNPGSRLMLVVSLLWSVTSTIHRVAIKETNPYFYAGISGVGVILMLTLWLILTGKMKSFKFDLASAVSKNFSAGVLGSLALVLQFSAQALAPASYVIAVKRTSIVFSSILASIFFQEPFSKRILPTLMSVVGVILIGISLA